VNRWSHSKSNELLDTVLYSTSARHEHANTALDNDQTWSGTCAKIRIYTPGPIPSTRPSEVVVAMELYYNGAYKSRLLSKATVSCDDFVNTLNDTLKPHSNGPLYSNMVIGRTTVDGWAVTFGTARRDLGGLRAPSFLTAYCTKCSSPPINGQCTNFILSEVAP